MFYLSMVQKADSEKQIVLLKLVFRGQDIYSEERSTSSMCSLRWTRDSGQSRCWNFFMVISLAENWALGRPGSCFLQVWGYWVSLCVFYQRSHRQCDVFKPSSHIKTQSTELKLGNSHPARGSRAEHVWTGQRRRRGGCCGRRRPSGSDLPASSCTWQKCPTRSWMFSADLAPV